MQTNKLIALLPALAALSCDGQNADCVSINGLIETTAVTEGCTSPAGLCTAGTIQAGPLQGTTRFTALSLAPFAGMDGAVEPTTMSYAGDIVITTSEGELTIRDIGIFDTMRGTYSSVDFVQSGTGRFENAQGRLHFYGTGTSSFVAGVSGELCGI